MHLEITHTFTVKQSAVPLSDIHVSAGALEMREAVGSGCNALSAFLSCSYREEDRAKATMVFSSNTSAFFLGFFAGTPLRDEPFLFVDKVSVLQILKKVMRRSDQI